MVEIFLIIVNDFLKFEKLCANGSKTLPERVKLIEESNEYGAERATQVL